jgi:hypothetical protein
MLSHCGESLMTYQRRLLVWQLVSLSRHLSSGFSLIDSPALIPCIFHASYEDKGPYIWPVADPLSPETCADDIFNNISAHLLEDQVHWVNFRLCRLTKQSGDLLEQYQFCLPRNESISGNLAWMREQIQAIICRHNATRCYCFQLHMCPRREKMPDFYHNRYGITKHPGS